MSIQFFCPHGHRLNAPDTFAGRKITCPKCNSIVYVPEKTSNTSLSVNSAKSLQPQNWFVRTYEGDFYGPISTRVLQTWYLEGRLHNATIQKEGTSSWISPDSIFEQAKPPVYSRPQPASTQDHNAILRIKNDFQDILLFYKECLCVHMRLNPFHIACYFFGQAIESLNDYSQPDERVSCFENAFSEASTVLNDNDIQSWNSNLYNTICSSLGQLIELCEKAFPDYRIYLGSDWAREPKQHLNDICCNLYNQVYSLIPLQNNIINEYNAMCELFPKWRAPLERTGILEGILAFAAGFFGGELGCLGAAAYSGFRDELDSNNIDQFSAHLQNWMENTGVFMENLENIFYPMLEQLMGVVETALDDYLKGLILFAQKGGNVQKVFNFIHTPTEIISDEEERNFFETVFNNLRESGLSYKSERNLREMIGLRN